MKFSEKNTELKYIVFRQDNGEFWSSANDWTKDFSKAKKYDHKRWAEDCVRNLPYMRPRTDVLTVDVEIISVTVEIKVTAFV